MVLPETLLKILVCPVDKGCLMYFADENLLYNPRLRRAYRIERGVPVMLAERAEPVGECEHERLMTRVRDGAVGLSAAGLHQSADRRSGQPLKNRQAAGRGAADQRATRARRVQPKDDPHRGGSPD